MVALAPERNFSIASIVYHLQAVKQLLILRHAKSDWGNSSLADWQRPLNERGERDAPRVGARLRERSVVPDLIVTSDAIRARTTAEAAAKAADYTHQVVLEPTLYAASPATILDVVSKLPDTATTAMIVAHNPGLEDFIEQLAGEPVPLPTAGLVQIEIPIDQWSDLDFSIAATILDSWRPKD
jgi:phosphohistidine phosphatase